MSRKAASAVRPFAGLSRTPSRTALGTNSCKSPNRLATTSPRKKLIPVALPPGRARLATRPVLTGFSATPKTIGIVAVAALAASAVKLPPGVAITATWRRTRSAIFRDPRPRNLDRASARDHALGRRGRQPGAYKFDHPLDREAVRDHDLPMACTHESPSRVRFRANRTLSRTSPNDRL